MSEFTLVREYLLSRLGAENIGDGLAVTVVESERRLHREMSYGYIHLVWIVAFGDSIIASVPPGTSEAVKAYIRGQVGKKDITDRAFVFPLKALVEGEAKRLCGKTQCNCFSDLMFACDAETLAPARPDVTPARVIGNSLECCGDIHFPGHCLPDGIVYGIIEKGKIVSVAYAHQTGEYQDIVADIGVETSKRFRRKGYARACVNAVARHAIENGGESLYKCSPDNMASRHTALSAGYRPYGKSLIFSVKAE